MPIELTLILGFIFHLLGDYIFQNDWMANNKTKRFFPAFLHATIYSLPFLLITSFEFWLIIYITHFLIDRYRLAVYWIRLVNVKFLKTFKLKLNVSWYNVNDILKTEIRDGTELKVIKKLEDCHIVTTQIEGHPWWKFNFPTSENFGYWKDKPMWMSLWLMIIIDNIIHICINSLTIILSTNF